MCSPKAIMKEVNECLKIKVAALFFLCITGFACGNFVDYSENTELIQLSVGSNITLECSLKGLINENQSSNVQYYWYFKQCGQIFGSSHNCFDNNHDDDKWFKLACENDICLPTLQIRNISEDYTGLYKCTVVPTKAVSLDIKLVRTFQLDIKTASQKMPVFVNGLPLNQSVSLGSQAVFQCRVYSDEHFTIKWFRRLPALESSADSTKSSSSVYYNGKAYELMTTPQKRLLGRDVYLSKLILNRVRSHDEGFYACVAINIWGHIIREVYLKIYSSTDNQSTDNWLDYSEEIVSYDHMHSDPKEFWLLFLIPFGLALLPISVWIFYVTYKRCHRQQSESMCSEENLASKRILRT